MTEDEAKEAVIGAAFAVQAIEDVIRGEIRAATDAIQAKHAGALRDANLVYSQAKRALTAAKDATPDHPWTGKRVFREETIRHRWSTTVARVDRFEGIVETFRSTTSTPANMSAWGRPEIGTPIVRLLKKDGSPGVKFEIMREHKAWKLVDETAP